MATYIVNAAGGESKGLIVKAPRVYATEAAPTSPGGTITPAAHGQQYPPSTPIQAAP
jgi:hypothetical protein